MGADDEALAKYLAEVRGLPLLFAVDEADLLTASRRGDDSARKRLLEGHLVIAALLALRLPPRWMRPIDAIQEANVVLNRLLNDESVAVPVRELTSALIRHYDEIEGRTS